MPQKLPMVTEREFSEWAVSNTFSDWLECDECSICDDKPTWKQFGQGNAGSGVVIVLKDHEPKRQQLVRGLLKKALGDSWKDRCYIVKSVMCVTEKAKRAEQDQCLDRLAEQIYRVRPRVVISTFPDRGLFDHRLFMLEDIKWIETQDPLDVLSGKLGRESLKEFIKDVREAVSE